MSARMVAAIAALVTACTTSRVVFRDPATGYTVKHDENLGNKHGERGAINPVVLEYILAAPESPLVAYYDLVATAPERDVGPKVAADLRALRPAATALAGGHRPTGVHYARALARRLVPQINEALAHAPQRSGQLLDGSLISVNPNPSLGKTYEGTAGLWWGAPVDLDTGRLRRAYEYAYGETTLRTVIFRHASLGLVVVRSSGSEHENVWDVTAIAGAFDPQARLDPDQVAHAILALHARRP